MSVPAVALRELHQIHQQLAELRDRMERGPKQIPPAKLTSSSSNPSSPPPATASNKPKWRSTASSST